jgi:hypothetical protein
MCTALATRLHSHELYRQGAIHRAVEGLVDAWNALPSPREYQEFGTVIAAELAAIHLYDLNDCDGALEWTRVLARCRGPHASMRTVDLMFSRIEVARGDIDAARTHLTSALRPPTPGL